MAFAYYLGGYFYEIGSDLIQNATIALIAQLGGGKGKVTRYYFIQVSSPSTAEKDQTLKQSIYAEYGVREDWIVDLAAQTVEVLTWTPSGYSLDAAYVAGEMVVSPLPLGLQVDVSEILAPWGY